MWRFFAVFSVASDGTPVPPWTLPDHRSAGPHHRWRIGDGASAYCCIPLSESPRRTEHDWKRSHVERECDVSGWNGWKRNLSNK
jgi:hypothetical protein